MIIREANPEDSAAIAEITAEGLGYTEKFQRNMTRW